MHAPRQLLASIRRHTAVHEVKDPTISMLHCKSHLPSGQLVHPQVLTRKTLPGLHILCSTAQRGASNGQASISAR